MRLVIDVSDFGEISLGSSPDNRDCLRLRLVDSADGSDAFFDLTAQEAKELSCALEILAKTL